MPALLFTFSSRIKKPEAFLPADSLLEQLLYTARL